MPCKNCIERKQIFGNPDDMGTLEDIEREAAEREEEEKALAESEAEDAEDAQRQEKMRKRGNKGLTKFK